MQNAGYEDYGVYKDIQNRSERKKDTKQYCAELNIEGKNVKLEIDSGSGYTFLPRSQFRQLKINASLLPTKIVFRSYIQTTFVPDCKIIARAKYNNVEITDEIYIVGRSWIRRLEMNLNNLDIITTNVIKQLSPSDDIVRAFPEIFKRKIGCITQYKILLKLGKNVFPSYTKERTIPYSLTQCVDKS